MKLIEKYFCASNWITLVIFIVIYVISFNIEFKFIFTDSFYLESFKNKEFDDVLDFIKKDRELEWVNYLYIPLIIIIPSLLTSFSLFIGAFLSEFRMLFSKLFNISLKSQIIFAINYLVVVILKWQGIISRDFYNINNNYDFQSARLFFKNEELPLWLVYPLQCVNITEFIYILSLSTGVMFSIKINYFKAIRFVLFYYGIGLTIWIIFSVFIQTMFFL